MLVLTFIPALFAYFGWQIFFGESPLRLNGSKFSTIKIRKNGNQIIKQLIGAFISFIGTFLIALVVTTSLEISTALALLAASIPMLAAKFRAQKATRIAERAWPEVIDQLISSLHAGRSITESVVDLNRYGPLPLRDVFSRISEGIEKGATLEQALKAEIAISRSAAGDQVLAALIFAKEYGGSDVTNSLRLLATFLRDDAQAQEDIETRFGWVKNSAVLGAVAPWLLLALLSMQSSTVAAYSTATGRMVLTLGVVATAGSFIWMERIARLPSPARPFRDWGSRSE
jgi:tight adherence protein B